MVNGPLILSFDVGTQSMRALLVDTQGDILDKEQYSYPEAYFSPKPNWAEQKPDFYYEVLCSISKKLMARNEDKASRVIATVLAVIRDTVICLDKDLKPLSNFIVWLDKRETNKSAENVFSPFKKTLFSLVGMTDTVFMQYRQSVCNWLMENEPELWRKTYKFVLLPTYLNYRLTGNLIDSPENQIAHLPFDYKNRIWMKSGGLTRCLFDVPTEKLCDLIPAGSEIGTISPEKSRETGIPAGIPLIATGSDKSCETLGVSVTKPHQAALSFGTNATVQFTTKKFVEPKPFLPAYPSVCDGMYNPEIQIYRGYWMLSWFKKEFAEKECAEAERLHCVAEELLNKHLDEVPPGCEGLILQPFWSPGVIFPNARGSIVGFSDVHTKIHIYRAIIEGIGYALMDGLYAMEKQAHTKITELFIAGGGSKSDTICQITSDMFGLPVNRIQTHEACSLGAAMVGFKSKGVFSGFDEAISSMVRVSSCFTPNSENHEVYKKLYSEVYSKLYSLLEPLYRKTKAITR